ncbi:Myb-like_DNA-binding domain-containing protein [Hexamita inflata]|uniref:Myb-like DNA-binding domain-containing protein n=2 Tax=Hexamita inflata TaxID=28002 RepID=A0AA86NVZ1_9EUKA|nr:Myb-like DNA-binding domain-containing protein [Hexamita inflata]
MYCYGCRNSSSIKYSDSSSGYRSGFLWCLTPMSYSKWSSQEEFKLKAAVDKYGNDWNAIRKNVFPERGAVCLKNKYYSRIHQNKAFDAPVQINTIQEQELNQNEADFLQEIRDLLSQIQ